MSIGSVICSKRSNLNMSQDIFAERMGVARQTVSSWENDKFLPDTARIIEMSNIFNCSIDDLLNPTSPSAMRRRLAAKGTGARRVKLSAAAKTIARKNRKEAANLKKCNA